MSAMIKEFPADGDFGAADAAQDWLSARGFSYGPSQADGPQAIWHGDCFISKWRNLSAKEKASCDATMEARRGQAARITLRQTASADALTAWNLTDDQVAERAE